MKRPPRGPMEWANELDGVPPIHIKNTLIQFLKWQGEHKRSCVNIAWYLHHVIYSWKTRHERREKGAAIQTDNPLSHVINGVLKEQRKRFDA